MNHLESFASLLNEGCEDFQPIDTIVNEKTTQTKAKLQKQKQTSDALNKFSKTLKHSKCENIVESQFELQKHMVLLMKNMDDLELMYCMSTTVKWKFNGFLKT